MIACKAFAPGLICRGYQFHLGMNTTEKANCRQNGFHCAEDPLDCITYYPDINKAVFCLVDAGGDIDEDDCDSKIACTELNILKILTLKEYFLFALAYIRDHPKRKNSCNVSINKGIAQKGFVVVRGTDPIACGKKGDYLAFAKENISKEYIEAVSLVYIDGDTILPDTWYDIDLKERGKYNE